MTDEQIKQEQKEIVEKFLTQLDKLDELTNKFCFLLGETSKILDKSIKNVNEMTNKLKEGL